jgi:hypothetical protein
LPESLKIKVDRGVLGEGGAEDADDRHPLLLRTAGVRQERRGAK